MGTGWMWRSILELLVVFKMNVGPYRSGQWYDAKREACKRWVAMYDARSQEFDAIACKFAANAGVDISTAEGRQLLWARMRTLKSCNEKGPILKLMRWLSLNEVWWYHREELWGLKAILRLMAEESCSGGSLVAMSAGTTTGCLEASTHALVSKSSGTISKAHTYISETNEMAMNIFVAVTSTQRSLYSHRAKLIKSIDDHAAGSLKFLLGAWKHGVVNTTATTMFDVQSLT